MTQTELVRITEKLVFEAEASALHKRAMMRVEQRQAKRDQQAREWSPHGVVVLPKRSLPTRSTPPPVKAKPAEPKATPVVARDRAKPGPKEKLHAFAGQTLTLRQCADKLGIAYPSLTSRIFRNGGNVDAALAAGNNDPRTRQTSSAATNHRTGGHAETLHEPNGTGGGKHETDFEGNDHEL